MTCVIAMESDFRTLSVIHALDEVLGTLGEVSHPSMSYTQPLMTTHREMYPTQTRDTCTKAVQTEQRIALNRGTQITPETHNQSTQSPCVLLRTMSTQAGSEDGIISKSTVDCSTQTTEESAGPSCDTQLINKYEAELARREAVIADSQRQLNAMIETAHQAKEYIYRETFSRTVAEIKLSETEERMSILDEQTHSRCLFWTVFQRDLFQVVALFQNSCSKEQTPPANRTVPHDKMRMEDSHVDELSHLLEECWDVLSSD